jgi:aminopeptidase N
MFGPPALKTLTVAPIPGAFGQGFPGLVYLSTVAYLDPRERPAAMRDAHQQVFFSDLMEAHEVAHQWWGNVVTANDYQDEWLLESLADYSALLWLEKKKGAKAFESVLEDYRDHLVAGDGQGHPVESAGPVVWGRRLFSSGVPDAWRIITYEKGAWIMHMLRRRLGDERFLKMLAELRRRYEARSFSTEDFRALVKEFLPPGVTADSIDTFFDNWVYSTGVPSLKVRYAVKGAATSWTVSGTLTQSDVDDDFSADIPLEIQFARGAPRTIWVRTDGDSGSFSATVRQQPVRVAVAAADVLAKK